MNRGAILPSQHVVHLGDCLTGMAALPDKSIDHVICDPPYSERVHSNSRRNNSKGGRRAAPVAIEFGFAHLDERTMREASQAFARITRRWVLAFCATEHVGVWLDALEDVGMEFIRAGTWVKGAPAPQFTGDRPASGTESIVIAHATRDGRPVRKQWNGGGRVGVWEAGVIGKNHVRHHTAEKPLDLMEALVRDFTDPGELVLDPFAGSGTTGVACKRLGRRFLGWERDPKYHAIAVKRIERTSEQFALPGMTP